MRAFILAASAAFSFASIAAPIATSEQDGHKLVLSDEGCKLDVDKSFANLAALRTPKGEIFAACFRINGQMIELIYEDGDIGRMPISAFEVVGKPA